jgi:hypothetical protein
MTDQELVDLLSYLTTLRQPVSIVGEYQVIGPLNEPDRTALVDPASKLDLQAPVADGRGHQLSWRRASANAEGQADLTSLVAGDPKHAAYASVPVDSPIGQQATLVLDTPAEILVWLNGKRVALSATSQDKNEPRTAVVDLPEGVSTLLIRVARGGRPDAQASLVTTFVADRPVGFYIGAFGPSSGAAK